jgi:urease accessory protein
MKKRLALLMSLAATPALAHTGVDHVHSLASGFMHPFAGLDHLAAMLATGIVGSAFVGWKKLAAPAAFLSAMLGGYGLALAGLPLPAVEAMILASVLVMGVLCILPQRLVSVALIAASFAVFHGYAHGQEAGAGSILTFGLGFVAASAALMVAGVAAGTLLRPAARRKAV